MSYQCWSNEDDNNTKLPDYKVYFQSDIYENKQKDTLEFYYFLAATRKLFNLKSLCPRNLYSICPQEDRAAQSVTNSQYLTSNTSNKQCTMLLLLNLAKPQWITIGCHDKLVKQVVCSYKKEHSSDSHVLITSKRHICERTSVLYKGWCFLFFPCTSSSCTISKIIATCRNLNLLNVFQDEISLDLFTVIQESISIQNIYFAVLNKEMMKLNYFYAKRNTAISRQKGSILGSVDSKNSNIFFPCKTLKFEQSIQNELIFGSWSKYFVSINFLCDVRNDNISSNNNVNPICNFPFLFYKSITGKYKSYSQQKIYEIKHLPQINSHMEDHKYSHYNILSNEEMFQQNSIRLTCQNSPFKWYNFSHVCIFRLDKKFPPVAM